MNPAATDEFWTRAVRRTLELYDEPLLRNVANKLCKPRGHWPTEELLERSLATLSNAAVLDRRLKDQPSGARMLLALIGQSRQPRWPVGSLIELLLTLGNTDALAVVVSLLQSGLLYPQLFQISQEPEEAPSSSRGRVKDFDAWIAQAHPPIVFAHPAVTARAMGEGFAGGPEPVRLRKPLGLREADGLEWPLRLAALWQLTSVTPLRRTQQGDFFKRDLDRLQSDPLLCQPLTDGLAAVPDPGLLTVALGLAAGLLKEADGELTAVDFPAAWEEGLAATIASLWSALPQLASWNAAHGWEVGDAPGNPHPSAHLLAVLLLARLPEDCFASPEAVEQWIVERHPFWTQLRGETKRKAGKAAAHAEAGIAAFLMGVAFPLRLLEAAKDGEGRWLVRLSAMGRWALGLGVAPTPARPFPQTVLVQPNLEILAYRQGLTPELIIQLGRFATWKTLGAACTLQLEPDRVYRALERGDTFAGIVQTLERHGMKALPAAVLDSLRTWSNKRERISVYPAAALFEFPGAAELNDAFARGFQAVRVTDRLAIVPDEQSIDYRHFRLTGTRDYCLPAEKCVDVEADGVTLSIDLARSDLLLETEVQGFAEASLRPAPPGRRLYCLTPASLSAARNNGMNLANLESWFIQRTGLPISPAARLLLTAADNPPLDLRRQLVLHVASAEIADGIVQWPGTRGFVRERLGPATLVIAEKDVAELQEKCRDLGLRLFHGNG